MIIKNDISTFPCTGKDLERRIINEAFPVTRAIRKEINRMMSEPLRVTQSLTLDASHFAILADSSAVAVNLTLPAHGEVVGTIYWLKCVDDTNGVTVIGTIDDGVNRTLVQYESIIIKAEAAGWYIYSDYLIDDPPSIEPDISYTRHTGIGSYTVYYASTTTSATLGGAALTADRLYAVPFIVPKAITADRIAVGVTIADAGKFVRLGIYDDTGNLYPGDLILDAGTVTVGVAGTQEITINQILTPGVKWLALVGDGVPNVRVIGNNGVSILGCTSPNGGTNYIGLYVAYAYAALPAAFPAGPTMITGASTMPAIYLRLSA